MDARRYHGLDALRGFMMILGIVLHSAMLYLAWPPPAMPIPAGRDASPAMDVVLQFIHAFRMPTFFVLSGFFAALLVEKRGAWGALRNRAARVLAPLLAGAVSVLPLAGILMLAFLVSAKYGVRDLWPERSVRLALGQELRAAGVPVDRTMLGHLWFLYYLCLFYILTPACRAVALASLPWGPLIARRLATPAGLAVLGLATAATLWPHRDGRLFDGNLGLIEPHLPSLAYYGLFYVLGYVLHAHRGVLEAFGRCVPWAAGLALILFPLGQYASWVDVGMPVRDAWVHLLAVVANAYCTWALIYFFIGAALRFFDRATPWVLYLSPASYWVFLVHPVPVFFMGWLLQPVALPALAKFAAVAGTGLVFCFVTYHYGVRKTWVNVFLNGRRFEQDWPWKTPRAGKL